MKKLLLFSLVVLVFQVQSHAQNIASDPSLTNDIISKYNHLPAQQLLDTANYYFEMRNSVTALICYNLLLNTATKDTYFEHQKRIIEAYHRSAGLYYFMCDYRSAYDCLIKALLICEKTNDVSYKPKIYTNIGNIYYRFKKYDIAKSYYSLSLNLCKDSTTIIAILNNLGSIELKNGEMDSAYHFLNQSLQISKRNNNHKLFDILNSMALFYQERESYDTALYYYKLSLEESRKNNQFEPEAQNLSDLSKLFFEINKPDSALFYINLSNGVAKENHFLRILSENYLTLSKIEEKKRNAPKAFEFFKEYAALKDSVFNLDNFSDINQLQRLYEVSKTNQHIEQLYIEQQIKERTIHYQKIILFFTLFVLLLVSIGLLYIYFQKRNLGQAYKTLFEKNIQIIELQEDSHKKMTEKSPKKMLTDDMQHKLLDQILTLMKDHSIICNSDFSLDKLAELVQSNQNYVSQVINKGLNQNFRSLLNSYRIREAQRLFASAEAEKFTIESVALQVGFKSRNTFNLAFKDITGVSPNFYLKSIQEQQST